MDESLGDSGCGDGCAGYPNNGYPIHNSNNHRHRNMPLADALDLSNRFFQQSGKPNWKRERENPLLIDALCDGHTQLHNPNCHFGQRKRRSSMTHNDHFMGQTHEISPVQNNNLDEPGLYGIEGSLDRDQQEELTAFYRSVILHKNVCWGTATLNDQGDILDEQNNRNDLTQNHALTNNRAVTENNSNLFTDTTTNPGNLSYDHFNETGTGVYNSTSYSTRSNYNYAIRERGAPGQYDSTSHCQLAHGISRPRKFTKNYSSTASTSAVQAHAHQPYKHNKTWSHIGSTKKRLSVDQMEFNGSHHGTANKSRLSSGGGNDYASLEHTSNIEIRSNGGGPQFRKKSLREKRNIRQNFRNHGNTTSKSCYASSSNGRLETYGMAHRLGTQTMEHNIYEQNNNKMPFPLTKSKSSHKAPMESSFNRQFEEGNQEFRQNYQEFRQFPSKNQISRDDTFQEHQNFSQNADSCTNLSRCLATSTPTINLTGNNAIREHNIPPFQPHILEPHILEPHMLESHILDPQLLGNKKPVTFIAGHGEYLPPGNIVEPMSTLHINENAQPVTNPHIIQTKTSRFNMVPQNMPMPNSNFMTNTHSMPNTKGVYVSTTMPITLTSGNTTIPNTNLLNANLPNASSQNANFNSNFSLVDSNTNFRTNYKHHNIDHNNTNHANTNDPHSSNQTSSHHFSNPTRTLYTQDDMVLYHNQYNDSCSMITDYKSESNLALDPTISHPPHQNHNPVQFQELASPALTIKSSRSPNFRSQNSKSQNSSLQNQNSNFPNSSLQNSKNQNSLTRQYSENSASRSLYSKSTNFRSLDFDSQHSRSRDSRKSNSRSLNSRSPNSKSLNSSQQNSSHPNSSQPNPIRLNHHQPIEKQINSSPPRPTRVSTPLVFDDSGISCLRRTSSSFNSTRLSSTQKPTKQNLGKLALALTQTPFKYFSSHSNTTNSTSKSNKFIDALNETIDLLFNFKDKLELFQKYKKENDDSPSFVICQQFTESDIDEVNVLQIQELIRQKAPVELLQKVDSTKTTTKIKNHHLGTNLELLRKPVSPKLQKTKSQEIGSTSFSDLFDEDFTMAASSASSKSLIDLKSPQLERSNPHASKAIEKSPSSPSKTTSLSKNHSQSQSKIKKVQETSKYSSFGHSEETTTQPKKKLTSQEIRYNALVKFLPSYMKLLPGRLKKAKSNPSLASSD